MIELLRWLFFSESRASIGRLFWVGLGPVVLAACLNASCQTLGFYEAAEWADLDKLQRTAASESATQIVLVSISDADYADIFNRVSPLDPDKVIKLVQAICAFRPTAVGVDLLTADWTERHRQIASELATTCGVLWVADVTASFGDTRYVEGLPTVTLDRVLGEIPNTANGCWALSVVQPDDDGVVRRYTTHYPVTPLGVDGGDAVPLPTFGWAMAKAPWSGLRCAAGPVPSEWYKRKKFPFGANGTFPLTDAKIVLDSAENQGKELFQELQRGIFNDAPIVILGGRYRQARDRHRTPVGMLDGLDIIANIVHAERTGLEIRDVSPAISLPIDLATGLVLLALLATLRLRWPWAIAVSGALTAVAALVLSWTLFRYLGYFLGVFGALSGVVIGVAVEACWDPFMSWWREFKERARAVAQGKK